MEPTLLDQDRLIVNKAIYKFFEDPQPGDIVMHYYPADPDKSFVKRIIAAAGDTVRIEDGSVYVNEVAFPDAIPPEYRSHEDYGPEVVQDAYYFVMGDHRSNSSDSPHLGPGAEEVHRRQGAASLVAAGGCDRVLNRSRPASLLLLRRVEPLDGVAPALRDTRRFTLSVGVSSPVAMPNSVGSRVERLICSCLANPR